MVKQFPCGIVDGIFALRTEVVNGTGGSGYWGVAKCCVFPSLPPPFLLFFLPLQGSSYRLVWVARGTRSTVLRREVYSNLDLRASLRKINRMYVECRTIDEVPSFSSVRICSSNRNTGVSRFVRRGISTSRDITERDSETGWFCSRWD